jgi:signal transduction histidine kinase
VSSSAEPLAIRPARWPWIAFGIFLAIAIVALVLVSANGESLAEQWPYVIAFTMFGAVGALIVSRDRHNTIGRMLLAGSVLVVIGFGAGEFTTWAVDRGRGGVLTQIGSILNASTWLLGLVPIIFLLPLFLPDGRLPSRRWRPFLWFVLATIGVLVILVLLGDRTMTGSSDRVRVPNPLYVPAIGRIPPIDPVFGFLFPVIFGLSSLSLFLRFRRSRGAERQQIKWVVFGVGVAFVGIVVSGSFQDPVVNAIVNAGGFLAFPVSIGIAVLRFHLYDLDVVVRKTVVYAAFAVFATLVYLAIVVGLGATLGRGNSFLTMMAAVVVAVSFQPVRGWLTRFANRLVYGKRATPYEVLSEFSERVGDAYADEDVLPRMARILGEGVAAERADVWLAVDRELRDVASWPAAGERLDAIPLRNGTVPAIEGAERVYPVEQAGELLGALAVRKPASDPVSPSDEKLIADLAAQAGLVLRNVRLTEELKARLDDLKAAQKRLVSAQDEERRKLERNIHDGAQQQLVALAVKARLARSLADRDPAKTIELLEGLEAETQDALENLRDLARGIYPPLLADKGLVSAVEAQGRKASMPVELRAEGVGRLPRDVEAAAYFSILEALNNVAKYAGASRAIVRISAVDGSLAFEVEDDGRGFAPGSGTLGTGLQGIADRLTALDGTVEVRSSPGSGTTVAGRVPLPHEVSA